MDKLDDSPAHKEYGVHSKTIRGETVRSLGEKKIADYFHENRIKYTYEDQAKTTKSAFRSGISHPDFYLPEYEIYVEYWGLIDVGETDQRKKYREDMQWKMRRYSENGIKFISLYPWNLNDLNGAFRAEFKKVTGKDLITGAVGAKSVYAVPLSKDFSKAIWFRVPQKLELLEVQLVYSPHYFVEFDCFAQGKFWYNTINLASRGVIVLEGQTGDVVDISVKSGTPPEITRTGVFVDCYPLQQKEILRSYVAEGLPLGRLDAIPVKISGSDAEKITKVEIAKHVHQTFHHHTRNSSTSQTLVPMERDVRIVVYKLLNIPIATVLFRFKDKVYSRTIQAATNNFISDEMMSCYSPEQKHRASALLTCEECGTLVCRDHARNCSSCNKILCSKDSLSKGLLIKKYYCKNDRPQ